MLRSVVMRLLNKGARDARVMLDLYQRILGTVLEIEK